MWQQIVTILKDPRNRFMGAGANLPVDPFCAYCASSDTYPTD